MRLLPILLATLAAAPLLGAREAGRPGSSSWPTASPESQGFDSRLLASLIERVRERQLPLHRLVVIRRGQLLLDATLYPDAPDRPHDEASVTKSITSLLIGIAIDKGYIDSVHQPVTDLLPATARGPVSRGGQPSRSNTC